MTYFNGTTSAPPPPGVIAQSRSGYLVTTSDDEESSSVGEAFRVTTSGALTTLHLFSAAEPNRPFSGLILGRDGLFYGTTYYGGASNTGSIFTMTADGAVTTLYVFGSMAQVFSSCNHLQTWKLGHSEARFGKWRKQQ